MHARILCLRNEEKIGTTTLPPTHTTHTRAREKRTQGMHTVPAINEIREKDQRSHDTQPSLIFLFAVDVGRVVTLPTAIPIALWGKAVQVQAH